MSSSAQIQRRIAQVKKQFEAHCNNRKKYPIADAQKFNTEKVKRVHLTESTIQKLLDFDKNIKGEPKFIFDLLNLKPSQYREQLVKRPELINLIADKQFLVIPNIFLATHEDIIDDPKKAKLQQKGFGLIAWYIHPAILENSSFEKRDEILSQVIAKGESLRYGTFGTKDNLKKIRRVDSFALLRERDNDQLTNKELEETTHIPYLSELFNCDQSRLPIFKSLRIFINQHLKEVYGVDDSDKVSLCFHTHYNDEVSTLHLHIRVNQILHPLELDKSITLDEVIDALEKGKSIKQVILDRGVIHKVPKDGLFTKLGVPTELVDNPYLLDEIPRLKTS